MLRSSLHLRISLLLMRSDLARQAGAEFLGTGLLVAIVIGSGEMATRLTQDVGVQLLINAASTAAGLLVLITLFAPISGAHLNPVVTLAALAKRELSVVKVIAFIAVQMIGGLIGCAVANSMFNKPLYFASHRIRGGGGQLLGEVIATGGLILIIKLLNAAGDSEKARVVIPAWIGAAYFFTSSTSFANPAVTLARAWSNTFAGIAPSSVTGFILAELAGAAVGFAIAVALAPPERRSRALSEIN